MKLDTESKREFWSNVEKQAGDGCWLWRGKIRNRIGVARVVIDGNVVVTGVHRISYMIHNGPIPTGLLVRHTCDVRHCVRPKHLVLGTNKQNIQDSIDRGLIGKRKLPLEEYGKVASRLEAGEKVGALAEEYGVSRMTILKTRKGKGRRGRGGHQWHVVCRKCGIEKDPTIDYRTTFHKCS